ncbi:MAG TPA: nuclear transport factor 2 family protein [Actinomycetota bacterium]
MDVGSWLEAYRVAWEEADADGAAALFDEASTYRANIFEEPFVGREGVHRYWREVTATQEDVRVRIGRPFADGDRVAAEFWTTMRNGGEDVTLPGCLLLRFGDDGLCVSLREYWHYQPGHVDPPPEWGA